MASELRHEAALRVHYYIGNSPSYFGPRVAVAVGGVNVVPRHGGLRR